MLYRMGIVRYGRLGTLEVILVVVVGDVLVVSLLAFSLISLAAVMGSIRSRLSSSWFGAGRFGV